MDDYRLTKLECIIEILVKKGIITEKEISEEYNKQLKRSVDFNNQYDICHR